MKFFSNTVKGYYLSPNDLTWSSGVYFVYRCTHNAASNNVTLLELIYIGEAGNIRDRVSNHECYDRWKDKLHYGEKLCWSQCEELSDRKTLEAALIFRHKPVLNKEYIDRFSFQSASVTLSGTIDLLDSRFTLNSTIASLLNL